MWGLRTDTFRCRRAGKMDALPLTIPSGNVRIKGKLERTGKLEKYHAFSFDLKIAATKRRNSHWFETKVPSMQILLTFVGTPREPNKFSSDLQKEVIHCAYGDPETVTWNRSKSLENKALILILFHLLLLNVISECEHTGWSCLCDCRQLISDLCDRHGSGGCRVYRAEKR